LCESASKDQPREVNLTFGTPLGVGTSHGHLDTQESTRPRLKGSHHLPPYSILYSSQWRLHPNGTNSWTPEMESRNCPSGTPGTLNGHNSQLQNSIATRSEPSCSPCQDLSNDMLHTQIGCRKEVDSRLVVVGNQTVSLTPTPSFAHDLGCICPNDQCEAIFGIYVSRPFELYQEHPNARCFGPCCRALNIRESRRTPNPQLFQVLGFTPTLGQSGVATHIITWCLQAIMSSFGCHGVIFYTFTN
jgi:hypothetical protein